MFVLTVWYSQGTGLNPFYLGFYFLASAVLDLFPDYRLFTLGPSYLAVGGKEELGCPRGDKLVDIMPLCCGIINILAQ